MRIRGVDPKDPGLTTEMKRVFSLQTEQRGQPLPNQLLYARRPSIFRGARGMWSGIASSGCLDPSLIAIVNRRVALINGCEF